MKNLFLILMTIAGLLACDKDKIDLQNPDVKAFVEQLIAGEYNNFHKGEDGENLWLQMPDFDENDIEDLLEFAKDTSHIAAFPINPISSRSPLPEGRDYYILCECLLWIVEGIRNGRGFGSLDPYLIDTSLEYPLRVKGLTGAQILTVRQLYQDWWNKNKLGDWQSISPLKESSFKWF